jgi:hypothetical protein
MLCSGGKDDRRGLRPRLLFKTISGGKGAGPGNKNWMLRSSGMADRRGLRPRLLFKTIPSGKGAGTGKRSWMLCLGWMDDRRGLRPRLLREPAEAKGIGCCVLAGWLTDGAFSHVRSGPRYAEGARCTQEMPEGGRECHKIAKFSPALEP